MLRLTAASAAPAFVAALGVACAPAAPAAPAAAPSPPAASGRGAPTQAPAAASGTPVNGGTFTYGNSKPAKDVINPLNTIGTGQNVLIEALFLRLLYGRQWGDGPNPSDDGPLDLAVAEKMTEVKKDQIWEFELRQNVKWHDGQPVTADDVIFGIWLSLTKDAKATNETPVVGIRGGNQLRANGGDSVEGAKKLGDYAVRIELEQPIPNYWINWSVGYWPMPKHIFGAMPLDKIFDPPYATMPVGNGPFKAVRYVEGQYMEMEANPDFYLGRPHVDKFVVRFGDGDTLAAAMEAQEIDGTSVAAGPVYDRLTSLPYIVGDPVPTTLPNGFVVNFEQVPQGAALHKAIMYAIDLPTLNKQLYSDTLVPSNYLFGHVVGLEQPPAGFPTYSYDPQKAKDTLKQAGWDSGRELRWIMWSKPTAAQDALQAMLAAVGINAKYKIIDVATVTDQLYRQSEWDISFGNFSGDQDLESVWKYLKCGWNYDQGGFNYARYCNQEVDTLCQKGLAQTDAKQRKDLFDQVSLKLGEQPPQATLWRGAVSYVWNKRVKGAYPYQYRKPVRPALERVWIQQG
jgi:peptide/nickel transport system substrate-binding protein